MLEIDHLTKEYPAPGGVLRILSDINLRLAPGDAASIMGPSGSGKSTLLYAVGGLERPTSGTIRYDGQDLYTLSDDALAGFRSRKVGFIFQDHCLLPQCTALENVLVPALNGRYDAAVADRARRLLDAVGLGQRLDHRPSELSGGEKQRCAIARALLHQPGLLLCDEPTGNLDHSSAAAVADLLFTLQQEAKAILVVVTHSAELGGRFPIRFRMNNQTLEPQPS